MKPGDIVQVYRKFRVYNAVLDQDMFLIPGNICLLTRYKYTKEQYPMYDYFDVQLYTLGRNWTTTLIVENEQGVSDFIKVKK